MTPPPRTRSWSRSLRRIFRPFLTRAEKDRIAALIQDVESRTTAEIHVHVAPRLKEANPLDAAKKTFLELGLDKTKDRNGVLIWISHLDHRFAIWGDEGIHARAGHPLWERAKNILLQDFREGRYAEGVEACIRAIGRELSVQFPSSTAH